MSYRINVLLGAVAPPPIAEVASWVAGRDFDPAAPLIDLAQAEPSYAPDPALTEHLAGIIGHPETARYAPICGIPGLRAALARQTAAIYGGEIDAGQVGITAGCNQAFCLAMMALAREGDEVILPAPYYFNHRMWLDMLGIRAVLAPFRADRGGVPAIEDLEALIAPKTRAIVLVSPNNPTGAAYSPGELAGFYELARGHEIALVVDETYRDFLPGDEAPHDLFRRADWPGTFVHLYSFSKVYALTGYRVGAVVCGDELLAEISKAMDCVAICAPRIGQDAALFGIERLETYRREKRRLMEDRAEALRAAFRSNELAYEMISAGAFFAYVRHPFGGVAATEVARRLAAEHGLLCVPGDMFGPGQEPYLRLAFANVEAGIMPDVVRRLVASQS